MRYLVGEIRITLIMTFFGALLSTAIIGAVARFVIQIFSVTLPARFGGFCIAFGFAIARYSFDGPIDGRLMIAASASLGALMALIGLWYWLVAKAAYLRTDERE